MKIVLGYITNPNLKEAKKIAKILLEKRLIACANYFPIESVYWWGNKLTNDKEIVMIIKTIDKKWPQLESVVKENHSYNMPCILRIDVEVNEDYGQWVKKSVL